MSGAGTWSQSSTTTYGAVARFSAWLMLPAFAPSRSLRATYRAPRRAASARIASLAPSSRSQTFTRAPRNSRAAAIVGSTTSAGSSYTGTKTSTSGRSLSPSAASGGRERSRAHIHQKPAAWARLNSSAITSAAYSTGWPTRPGVSSQAK
jgi:hypothetical protein